MGRKYKIITSFVSLMFIMTFLVYSVWAVTNITYTITNTVSYTASANVYAKISATSAAGTNTARTGGTATDVTLNGDETSTEGTFAISAATLTATSVQSGQTVNYSYTITITNNAPSSIYCPYLKVEFTPPTAKTYADCSYGISVSYGGTIGTPAATKVLTSGTTLTMTVTFQGDARVTHTNINLGGSVKLTAQSSAS